jgi:hypothetical protein
VPAAAVAEAGVVSDEDLVRAKDMAVGATTGRLGHPLAVRGSDELTLVHPRTVVPINDTR